MREGKVYAARDPEMKEAETVIVGGGICGLATALALHRKGIQSVVLEKHKTPQFTGTAIIMQANGWHALDQLGIASELREKYIRLNSGRYTNLETGEQYGDVYVREGEMRCVKRSHLIQLMINSLPSNTIQWNCEVLSLKLDPDTSHPIMELHNGSYLRAKVVIGCDGVNSMVADFLGHCSLNTFEHCVVRGVQKFESNHNFGNEFSVYSCAGVRLGWFPMTNKLVYWFMTRKSDAKDVAVAKDPIQIRERTLEAIECFPEQAKDLVNHSDLSRLYLTRFKYRSPWDYVVRWRTRRGSVTLAGDAMHAMAPFIAQGGAAALEDAIVLGRCLACSSVHISDNKQSHMGANTGETIGVQDALDQYESERRTRVLKLSINNYLHGMSAASSSNLVKFVCNLLLSLLFPRFNRLSEYDCGKL